MSIRREGYRKEATARVRQGLAELLEQPASSLTRSDAAAALEALATGRGPITANRVMAYARACYGWGIKASLVNVNPFAGLAPPGRETARDRVLSRDEVRAIWGAAEALQLVPRAFARFVLLTLQRRGEVAGMRWSEVSANGETWFIPKERAKNGRAHIVHLAPAAASSESAPRGLVPRAVFRLCRSFADQDFRSEKRLATPITSSRRDQPLPNAQPLHAATSWKCLIRHTWPAILGCVPIRSVKHAWTALQWGRDTGPKAGRLRLPNSSGLSRRLLLVEDEVLLRELLADELREEGFDVTEAGTGDEAIRLLQERTDFDVVCTDVRMPGKADGIDVAVRARGRMPTVPVLVVSGYASELGRRMDVLAPPSAFLAKPFRVAQVSQTLRRLLAQ